MRAYPGGDDVAGGGIAQVPANREPAAVAAGLELRRRVG